MEKGERNQQTPSSSQERTADTEQSSQQSDQPPQARPGEPDRPPPRRSIWRSKVFWIIVAIIIAAGLAIGIPWYLYSRNYISTDDAFIEGHIVPVSSRVAGYAVNVYVNDNQFVHQGDLLVKLDPRDYEVRVQQAQAAGEAAGARFSGADNQHKQSQVKVNVAQESFREAQAQVAAAEAQNQRAQYDLARYQELYKTGVVTQQLYEHTETAAKAAAANVQAALRRADAARGEVASSHAAALAAADALRQEHASLDQALAALEQARLQLSYTEIYAPENGYVTHKTVQTGQYLQPGQAMLTIVEPDIWVTANYKETVLTHMQPGQPVKIRIDAYPGTTFHGHIESIQRGSGARFSLLPPENATGYYIKVVQRVPVKIVFDELPDLQHYHLGPGMSVEPAVNVSVHPKTPPQWQPLPPPVPVPALPPLPPLPAPQTQAMTTTTTPAEAGTLNNSRLKAGLQATTQAGTPNTTTGPPNAATATLSTATAPASEAAP